VRVTFGEGVSRSFPEPVRKECEECVGRGESEREKVARVDVWVRMSVMLVAEK
jgi:hypothetical protein